MAKFIDPGHKKLSMYFIQKLKLNIDVMFFCSFSYKSFVSETFFLGGGVSR